MERTYSMQPNLLQGNVSHHHLIFDVTQDTYLTIPTVWALPISWVNLMAKMSLCFECWYTQNGTISQISGGHKEAQCKNMLFYFRQDRTEMPKIGWTGCNQMHSGEVKWNNSSIYAFDGSPCISDGRLKHRCPEMPIYAKKSRHVLCSMNDRSSFVLQNVGAEKKNIRSYWLHDQDDGIQRWTSWKFLASLYSPLVFQRFRQRVVCLGRNLMKMHWQKKHMVREYRQNR